MNYDPNMVLCGRTAKQTVKLTFGQWEYRKEMTVKVGGNCQGFTILESAVGQAFDRLKIENGVPFIVMKKTDGESCYFYDEEDEGEEFLKELCLSVEIIDIKPDKE